jgi:type IX secretion system substrate protein
MKTLCFILSLMLFACAVHAQRGDIIIPASNAISVPAGAQICADRIYANNSGYGTLALADSSGICAGAIIVAIENIQATPEFTLEGFPSPCNEELTVRFTLRDAGATRIRLYDIMGRIAFESTQHAVFPAGSHSVRVSTIDLPPGRYMLSLESKNRRLTTKVIIQH